MNERELDCIKNVLSERECRAVKKLLEEVNDKSLSEDSVGFYLEEIKKTLKIISHRKNMLANALRVLEKHLECGKRDGLEFEENIKGSLLLNP